MITGDLKSKIDAVWNRFWSGGISNPLEVIEQITYLLFMRRLDDLQTTAEKKARFTGTGVIDNPVFLPGQQRLRWSRFEILDDAQEALSAFLDGSCYSAAQIRFVQMVVEHLTANGVVEPSELFDSPFTDHGDPTARLDVAEVHGLMDRLREVEARARVRDDAEVVQGA